MSARDAIAAGAGVAAIWAIWPRLRCWHRGHRNVRRTLPGWFACLDCGKRSADLGVFGMDGDGYVTRGWRGRAS